MSTNDIRAKWDRLLDDSPQEFAFPCRKVGDAVTVAALILHQEVGSTTPDAVVALAALILARINADQDDE